MSEVRARGFDLVLPDVIPSTLQLRHISIDPGATVTEVAIYYARSPIDEQARLADIIADGGMLIKERTPWGRDADFVQREVGDRATIVDVGPHRAALIWADPIYGQIRPYILYWSDGERDFSIFAGFETPEEVVQVVRSIYCPA